jgi:hypothetical protein
MSDNVLKLIPMDTRFLPEATAQQIAKDWLAHFVPDANRVRVVVTDSVEFVDPGNSLTRIMCPICKQELDNKWWQEATSSAYQKGLTDLTVTVPCCGAACSLNDLLYDWPAGFARFVLEAWNPNSDVDDTKIQLIQLELGCRLRKIWAHY